MDQFVRFQINNQRKRPEAACSKIGRSLFTEQQSTDHQEDGISQYSRIVNAITVIQVDRNDDQNNQILKITAER